MAQILVGKAEASAALRSHDFDMRQDASNNPFTAQVITSWIHHSLGIPWIQIFFVVVWYLRKDWKKFIWRSICICFFFFFLRILRLMSCCRRRLLPWRQLHSSWWLQHLHLSAFRENVGPFWEFTCRGWEVSPFWERFSNLFSNLVFLISEPIFTFQKTQQQTANDALLVLTPVSENEAKSYDFFQAISPPFRWEDPSACTMRACPPRDAAAEGRFGGSHVYIYTYLSI